VRLEQAFLKLELPDNRRAGSIDGPCRDSLPLTGACQGLPTRPVRAGPAEATSFGR
jgi:hypothetical protein